MDKSIKRLLITVFMVGLMVVIGTYAWYSFQSNRSALVLTVGDIDRFRITLSPYQFNGSLTPTSSYDDQVNGEYVNVHVDVTAVNNLTSSSKFTLYYQINSIDTELIDSYFKYTILRSTDGSTYTEYKSGNFSSATSNSTLTLLSNEEVPGSTTYYYQVWLWIDTTGGDQTEMQGKIFDGELRAQIGYQKLVNILKANAYLDSASSTYVSASTGINFSNISSDTNGKGLYIRSGTENDDNPIYYYRGNVTDNNLLYANYCWKIVRTTELGGIRIIYNGTPTDGTCNNTGTAAQIGTKAFNSSYNSPADVGYMYGTRYAYSSVTVSSGVIFGNTITQVTGSTYSLSGSTTTISNWSSDYANLSNMHYTCFNTTGTCTTYYYVYYTNASTAYRITLSGGKTVGDALSEMLDYNTNNSTIKGNTTTTTTLDYWYYNNIYNTEYENYLEDSIYCNDRSINSYGGWNPDGGNTTQYLYFGAYGRTSNPTVTCPRDIDKFTVSSSNGNGALTYPVGLLTEDEARMAGGASSSNSNYYLYTGQYWWLGSPYYFNNIYYASEWFVDSSGDLNVYSVRSAYGVRPVVSLKSSIRISGGDGTAEDPYIVELS